MTDSRRAWRGLALLLARRLVGWGAFCVLVYAHVVLGREVPDPAYWAAVFIAEGDAVLAIAKKVKG